MIKENFWVLGSVYIDMHAGVYVARGEEAEALDEACDGGLSCSALVIFTSFVT